MTINLLIAIFVLGTLAVLLESQDFARWLVNFVIALFLLAIIWAVVLWVPTQL